jgi:hypothetical protein
VLAYGWAIDAVAGAIRSSVIFAKEISLFPLPVSKQTRLSADQVHAIANRLSRRL